MGGRLGIDLLMDFLRFWGIRTPLWNPKGGPMGCSRRQRAPREPGGAVLGRQEAPLEPGVGA